MNNDTEAPVYISSLDDYQAAANRSAANDLDDNIALAVAALGLVGEAGEAAEIIKKYLGHGHELDREALVKELGDTLWYIARLTELLHNDLSHIASRNIAKLRARYPEGFSTAQSLKRCVCGHHADDHMQNDARLVEDTYVTEDPCTQCACCDYEQKVA